MPQHITVLNYDLEWPLKYERERKAIAEILDGNGIAIYHIGSTFIGDVRGKKCDCEYDNKRGESY